MFWAKCKTVLKNFVKKLLTNETLCPINAEQLSEDWTIPLCFQTLNNFADDSHNYVGREHFLIYSPESHLFSIADEWRKYYWTDEGLDYYSNYSLSFHYIDSKYMYTLYYLKYFLNPFEYKYQIPILTKRAKMNDIIQKLEIEHTFKLNISWVLINQFSHLNVVYFILLW